MKSLASDNDIVLENNTLFLKGPLTKETVMGVWGAFTRLTLSGASLCVDLNKVTHCDSASLAFLLELKRNTQEKNISISFTKMPKQMIETAKVNGLMAILSISEV